MTPRHVHAIAEALIDESLQCPCDNPDPYAPLCARCESLLSLVAAVENWGVFAIVNRVRSGGALA